MNYKEIEKFKGIVLEISRKGANLKNDFFNLDGKVMAVGFNPYWTSPTDSKIDKMEVNIMLKSRKVVPFFIYNIIGYKIKPLSEGKEKDKSDNFILEIEIFPPHVSVNGEAHGTVPIQVIYN